MDDVAILNFIETLRASSALVYVAIGCAQGRYPPGEHSAQEYPPFIRDFAGVHRRIAFLIDPELEDPPRALHDASNDTTVTFIPIRRPLFWTQPPPHIPGALHGPTLLRTLLDCNPHYIVVQDYTGENIALHDPDIPGRVLFDATYGDYGCFVDFTKHRHIPRDPVTDAILHLDRLPLRDIPAEFTELRHRQARSRASDLRYYIHRTLRVLRGQTEAAEWCSPAEVQSRLRRLAPIYAPAATTPTEAHLLQIGTEMLRDFGVPPADLLADPTGETLSRALADSPFLR
jgi:hypothetical protein